MIIMKILHILPDFNKTISFSFIDFINNNNFNQEHSFLFLGSEIRDVENIENDNIIIDYYANALQHMKKYDKIFFHHLFSVPTIITLKLLFNSNIIKKIYWVAWGADLYNWRKNGGLVSVRIKNLIRYLMIKRIRYFLGIFPPDIEYFKQKFDTNAKTYSVTYLGSLYKKSANHNSSHVDVSKEYNSHINLMVGHSSTSILNHLEVLSELSKFKNQNIRIFIPLSYGDSTYGDVVEKKSKELFGDKVLCIRTIMPKDEYEKFLSTIDIAIFNTERQIGLGNIIPLLDMGKKIYFPANSVMYRFFKSKEIEVFEYDNINELDFEKFIESTEMPNAKKYIESINIETQFTMWNDVFNA